MKALFMHKLVFFLLGTCSYACSPLSNAGENKIRPTGSPFLQRSLTNRLMIILRQNGFLRSYLKFEKVKRKRGNIAVSSGQTNAVQGLQVPPQNTTNTQREEGEVSKTRCRESLG